MTQIDLKDDDKPDILVEELVYLVGYADVSQWVTAYESRCVRESTLYKLCKHYNDQYGTHYLHKAEKALDCKLNPDGKWVD